MSYLIGVDAGGTRTVAVVARDETIVSRASGGPGAVRPGRALQAASRIATTARQALTAAGILEAQVLVVGAAGVGREPERSELREALRNEHLAERVVVTGDLDIALQAAFGSGPGVVLVSGTGSVAMARQADGSTRRSGGYGWQMGDEGSGYAIGRAALQAAGRAQDGRGPATSLAGRLQGAVSAADLAGLVRWSTQAEPGEVAALAPLVFQAAGEGDAVAGAIVAAAADELCGLALSLLPAEGGAPVPVALMGGNLAPGRALRGPLLARLRAERRFTPLETAFEPAEGAVALARLALPA